MCAKSSAWITAGLSERGRRLRTPANAPAYYVSQWQRRCTWRKTANANEMPRRRCRPPIDPVARCYFRRSLFTNVATSETMIGCTPPAESQARRLGQCKAVHRACHVLVPDMYLPHRCMRSGASPSSSRLDLKDSCLRAANRSKMARAKWQQTENGYGDGAVEPCSAARVSRILADDTRHLRRSAPLVLARIL